MSIYNYYYNANGQNNNSKLERITLNGGNFFRLSQDLGTSVGSSDTIVVQIGTNLETDVKNSFKNFVGLMGYITTGSVDVTNSGIHTLVSTSQLQGRFTFTGASNFNVSGDSYNTKENSGGVAIALYNEYDKKYISVIVVDVYDDIGKSGSSTWTLLNHTVQNDYILLTGSGYLMFNGSVGVTTAKITTFTNIFANAEEMDDDPYTIGGGSSGGGGGEGDFDDTSDIISIPSLPSVSGLNTGFFTAFVCTQSQLQSVSNYLWTDVIYDILDTSTGLGEKVDALKKMVTSPYDAIMGCSLVPVSPPTGGSKEVKMYGVVKTGISLPYASSRWVEVDCGTLNIHEFWGSYLDYSPYTKTTSLYLPYIGVVSVDIDLIMAKALQVVYHVDILSGICIAYIVVDGSVKFQYQGHCSTSIPVTASDFSGAIQSGLGLVGNIANVVSSGFSGGVGGSIGGAVLGATKSAISQAPSVASNVMGMKPDIKSGGGVGSSGGILGVQKPFLIIERPKQSVPAFQNGFSGYPCNMTKKLSDLTGYTEVERINLTNISLTEDEKNELLEILESGVYL